ncbi:MAG: ribose-5-phosphate isomerase [Rhodocyclaceae bacterium]|nr:ribose-5-phosphate isomerase [Rhodocyclaceae bacterium]
MKTLAMQNVKGNLGSVNLKVMPFHVYVIRLKEQVMESGRFAKANPDRNPLKPCVYVGSTALTPEERYQKHLTAKSGSRLVKQWQEGLHKRLTANQPTFGTRKEAEAHEAALAERLRKKGYAVWSR